MYAYIYIYIYIYIYVAHANFSEKSKYVKKICNRHI